MRDLRVQPFLGVGGETAPDASGSLLGGETFFLVNVGSTKRLFPVSPLARPQPLKLLSHSRPQVPPMFLIAWARLMLHLVQLGGGGCIFLPPPVHGEGAEAAGPWPMAWGCHSMLNRVHNIITFCL